MARLNRATSAFVRRELLKLFRLRSLPYLAGVVASRMKSHAPGSNQAWPIATVHIDVERIRPGVELMESIPGASRGVAPTKLERYVAELKRWKRRRTIAQSKVAKYARLVRYHRKGVAK